MGKFKGIIPALITPFKDDGELYINGLYNELKYLNDFGFENIFISGSYGSFPLMTVEERKTIIRACTEYCEDNNIKVIAQIGSDNPNESFELARYADECKVDAISSVVPYYYSTTIYNDNDFLYYFEKLINIVSVDVHLYNNIKTTGFNVTPDFLIRLIDCGLKGIKDGGSDLDRMMKIIEMTNESYKDFDYYPSSTKSLANAFIFGVESCISGVSLSLPLEVLNVYENIKNGNINDIIPVYKKIMKIRSILGSKCGRAISAYDILHEKGIDVGTCRYPWKRLNDNDREWLIKSFNEVF